MRKTIRSLPIIALALGIYFVLACNKKQVVIEEPKVENCVEAVYLGVGCGSTFFMLKDTTKVKGTYEEVWYSAHIGKGGELVEKKITSPNRVFIGLFWESKLINMKLIEDKTYFFEFRKTNPGERNTLSITGNCIPLPNSYDQIVLLDTLTSKCTKK